MKQQHARKRRKNKVSPKVRRMKRLRCFLWVILILLLALLGGIIFCKAKEPQLIDSVKVKLHLSKACKDTDKNATSGQEKKAQADNNSAEAKAKQEAAEVKAKLVNKDVQTQTNTATEADHKTNGLSICMYHYVYDKNNPPKELNNNFIEVHDLEKELQYLVENDYYFPTWEEVEQYVRGDLLLPKKSVVLTFDDGAYSFLNLGVPLFNKYKIPVTSFLIGKYKGEKKVKKYASEYLTFQSHSYNMHRAGGTIGHGGIFPALSHDEAVKDLEQSIRTCGNGDAFAYPYGDYTDDCIKAVKDAGFKCAVTTQYGRAKVGDDPLCLPRVRMLKGQSLDSFISVVE